MNFIELVMTFNHLFLHLYASNVHSPISQAADLFIHNYYCYYLNKVSSELKLILFFIHEVNFHSTDAYFECELYLNY